jgi:hypothetical protein
LQAVAANPDPLNHSMRTRVAMDVRALNELLDELSQALDDAADAGLESVLDAMNFPAEERETISELSRASSLSEGDDPPTLRDLEAALRSSRRALDETERTGDPEFVQIMTSGLPFG